MTTRRVALVAAAALAAFTASATFGAAQVKAQIDPSTRTLAASHFRQGQAYFQHEDYDRAIAEYQAAFDLSAEPSLIFNIGLCHDRMNRPEPALQAFQRYLALAPGGSVADEARNDVARLTPVVARLAAERAAGEARRREDEARRRDAAAAAARRQDEAAARRVRVGRYIAIGGGAVAVAGAAMHLVAFRTRDRLENPESYDAYRDDKPSFRIQRNVAYGLYAAGGAAIATGLIIALTANHHREGPQLSAALVPGGAAMVVEWSR